MRHYRSEVRTPCNAPAELSWEIGAGYRRNTKATVRDTSKSGMGLLVPMPFPVGTIIKITRSEKTVSATVRRCLPQGGQHLVGVKIQ